MRVLHILNTIKFSGAEVMLKAAYPKFKEANIETHVLSTGETEIGDFAPELANCGYIIHHIPFRKNMGYIKLLFKLLKENKFDVVHIHCEQFFFAYIIVAKISRIKRICRTIHSTFVFKGYLFIRRRTMLHVGKMLGCTYIAISEGVQLNEKRQNGISSVIINNWIDTNHFKPKEDTLSPSQSINIISIGTCSQLKQHSLILRLVSLLKDKNQKTLYYHLGSGVLEEQEMTLSKQLNIQESVFFKGNQTDVLNWLHKADFFLMPSLYEGLNISCCEAMSTGLIPIVNNVPGLRDLVEHNVNGLVVDFNDIQDVVRHLSLLIQDPEKISRLGAQARRKIEITHGLSNVDKLIKFYFPSKDFIAGNI